MTLNSKILLDEAETLLASIDEKAEIVNGDLIIMSPTGSAPGYAGDEIFVSLRNYARKTRTGYAVGDNKGFIVNLPHRTSFSPDAAFTTSAMNEMKFYEGAPVFVAEVRSANDYGNAAEIAIAAKRADYFAAGTLVVWDVDIRSAEVIRGYHVDTPDHPLIFRRGDSAHAEPVLPGWTMPVNDLFPFPLET